MKKYAWYLFILTLIGCTSGSDGDEQRTDKIDYSTIFHFAPQHGTENLPVSLIKKEKEYYLFYTTGSAQWGYAKSSNLIDWQITSSLDMPKNSNGDVIYDSYNTADLPNGPSWFIFYTTDKGIKRKQSGDGQDWTTVELNLPEGINGYPKISWYEPSESWIMVVTNEQSIFILSSSNLADWQLQSELDNTEAQYAQLLPLDEKWVLSIVGASGQYQIGTFDGSYFQSESISAYLDRNKETFLPIVSVNEGRVLMIAQLANNSFSSIRELSLVQNEIESYYLTGFPISEFKSKITSKRRGKLSNLRGDKSTWVSFPIDSISTSFEILISNEVPELVSVQWDKNSGEMTVDLGSSGQNSDKTKRIYQFSTESDQLQVDLLIDYQSIELFLNEGAFQLTTTINPSSIYNKIDVKVDGQTYDARSIFYGFITVN